MKKVLVGCLITAAVLVVGVGVAGYFFVIKPASEFVGGFVEINEQWETLNSQIDDQSDFEVAPDTTLAENQLQRYLAAQTQIKNQLGPRLKQLETKYDALKAMQREEGRDMNLGEIAGVYKDMSDLILEAKRAQVAAINAQDFSLEEYAWVRERTYRAIGASINVAAAAGLGEQILDQYAVDKATVDLVEPYREQLMDVHALAFFGL